MTISIKYLDSPRSQKKIPMFLVQVQIFVFFLRKICQANSESTRWGMLVTSWNSKATPDVPHPMSGHDFYSKLSASLG